MDVLGKIQYDKRYGYRSLSELKRMGKRMGIESNDVEIWYRDQAVNQILKRKPKIDYHKTIGNGNGYQADLMFFSKPELNDGYIGLLTMINTSTRRCGLLL